VNLDRLKDDKTTADALQKFLSSEQGRQLIDDIKNGKEVLKMANMVPVIKISEELGIVFGFAAITKVVKEGGQVVKYFDSDNQCVSDEVLLKATTEFMQTDRINNNDHQENDVGVVVHSFPLTEDVAKSLEIKSKHFGWLVGIKPNSETLKKFKSGEYRGFSIEGSCKYVDLED
jgi:hypothetical protein